MIYLGILRIKESEEEQIILDQNGYIQGFTAMIGQKLKLVEEKKTHIREICSQSEIVRLFKDASEEFKFEQLLETINTTFTHEEKKEASASLYRQEKKNRLAYDCRLAVNTFEYCKSTYYILSASSKDILFEKQMLGQRTLFKNKAISKSNSVLIKQIDEELFGTEEELEEEGENQVLRNAPEIASARLNKITLEEEDAYYKDNIMTKRDTQRGLITEAPIFDPNGEDNLDVGRTSMIINRSIHSTDSSHKLRIEQAVYYIPKNKGMSALNVLFMFIILFAGGILLVFQYQNTKVMQTVTDNVAIVGASITRLTRMINLYGLTLYLSLLDSKTIFNDRLTIVSSPDLRKITISRFDVISKDLADSSFKVRNLVAGLDKKLTSKLYESFPVHDFDESGAIVATRNFNSFDLVAEFRARMLKVGKMDPATINGNNTDVQFVRYNAINKFLLTCEEGINVIVNDTNVKIGNLTLLITLFLCLIGGFTFLLICVTLNMIREFLKGRDKMFSTFKKLDETEIVDHVNVVQKFCLLIQQYQMSIQRISTRINDRDLFTIPFKRNQSQIRREKPANMQGINLQIIKIFCLVLLLIILICSGYFVTFSIMTSQNSIISRKIGLMVNTNINLYYTYLRFSTINQYIGERTNITLRSQPYSEEFDRISARLASTNNLYFDVIDPNIGFGKDPLVIALFVGNLCEVSPSAFALSIGNPCGKLLGGISSKGMIALTNAYRYLVETMKATYDNSNKTHEDAVKLLNTHEFIEAQGIVASYLLPGCDKIGATIKDQLSRDAKKFTNSISELVIIYVVIYLTVVSLGWWKVKKMFSKEKAKWRRIIRLVPESLVENDKLLKNYLYSSDSRAI